MTLEAHRFSVAPMMDWTDRHCRVFHRIITQKALLYTEMVTAKAVIHADRHRLLGYDAVEHPIALQLGGIDPSELAMAARIGAEMGYDEINLNCGCPSDRVQSGFFGACLMQTPDRVAEACSAMMAAVKIPVTIKCRIGVDDQDEREALFGFVEILKQAGVKTFVIHARKAWLKGLSPKENRDIPPLNYDLVKQLKRAHPDLIISLNGGIAAPEAGLEHVAYGHGILDGMMLGRAAYHDPWCLRTVDPLCFDTDAVISDRFDVLERFRAYVSTQLPLGVPLSAMVRHILGLMQSMPGARAFRRILTTEAPKPLAGIAVLNQAEVAVREAIAQSEARTSNLSHETHLR